jgi:hypothetical protein
MGTLLMPDSFLRTPYGLLMAGVFSLLLAVASMLTGQSFAGRGGHTTNRSEDPKGFWWNVGSWFLIGVCLIGYYLYKVDGLPN